MRIKWINKGNEIYLTLKSKPIDQGSQGEILILCGSRLLAGLKYFLDL